jgi:hypothetical protein
MKLAFGQVIEVDPPVPGTLIENGKKCEVRRLTVVNHHDDGKIDAISAENDKVCIIVLSPGPEARAVQATNKNSWSSK